MSLPDAEKLWAEAVEHHLAGRLPEAERLYQDLLSAHRGGAKVLHMLGMAEFQQGRTAAGLKSLDAAIALEPGVAKYHGHRGLILASMGNSVDAVAAYRAALAIEPALADVLNNLGAALWNIGDIDGAIGAYRNAFGVDATTSQSAANLGSLLTNRGDHAEAVEILQKALEQSSDDEALIDTLAIALNNFGASLEQRGDATRAIELLREALTLKPNFADASFNLGKAFAALQQFDAAIAAYEKTISLKPESVDAYNNLGIVLCARGRAEDGILQYREALRQQPHHTRALNNLGNAYRAQGKFTEAESAYRSAIQIDPNDAELWSNLGAVLDTQERLDEALAAFEHAVAIRPAFSQAQNNIGNALKNLGDVDGAIAAYQRATVIDPDNQVAHSNRLYTMYFGPNYSAERIAVEHREWNAKHAAPLRPAAFRPRGSRQRLRIGYVAANFRNHCQSFFTSPLFSHHDHEQFEIFLYSDVVAPDAITERLRGCADAWRNICGMSDDAVDRLIQTDGIDVLVDLSLHMADNRLLVFARKPAPLQVTWLGYPGTTGLTTIDYRLTDPFLDPPAKQDNVRYSERSWRLPDTFWCYEPLASGPPVNEPPSLKNGAITFGCLNNFCKVNELTIELWSAVLRELPTSRMLLLAPTAAHRRIIDTFQRHGVMERRIEFVGRMSRERYLATYHRIDIGLDTIPYNGHTTTLDALWMGVPVVTVVGDAPAGRAGWSQLNNLQLQSLAATSQPEFVRVALQLANDLDGLKELRKSLRDRLSASPLMDGPRFTQNVEAAYGTMWRS